MHRRPHSGGAPPPCSERKFSINLALSSIMHQPLQPVTLLQPFNEAARPGGHRPHITPVKSRCFGAKPPWPQTVVKVMQALFFVLFFFVSCLVVKVGNLSETVCKRNASGNAQMPWEPKSRYLAVGANKGMLWRCPGKKRENQGKRG